MCMIWITPDASSHSAAGSPYQLSCSAFWFLGMHWLPSGPHRQETRSVCYTRYGRLRPAKVNTTKKHPAFQALLIIKSRDCELTASTL
jgi:hypothetical protein